MRRLVALAALVVGAVFASTAGAVTAPPQTFSDATGDSGLAADISSVVVTNDDKGSYIFTINFATPYQNSDDIGIFLDTDRNSVTGDPNGAGADFLFEDDYGSHSFDVATWSNNDWATAPSTTASVVVSSDNKSLTMKINKSELGNTVGFDFFVFTTDGSSGANGHYDDAPSGDGLYSYNFQTVYAITSSSFKSGIATAGGTWTVSLTAVRSDTGSVITSGASIACSAKEGSKTLPLASSSFSSAGAVCTFRVPKKPKHATVRATVTITANGQSVTKTFTATTG